MKINVWYHDYSVYDGNFMVHKFIHSIIVYFLCAHNFLFIFLLPRVLYSSCSYRMDRILSGAGTGSGSSEGEDSGDESHDQQGDVAMETPCSEEEDQREQQGGGNRLQSAISQLR